MLAWFLINWWKVLLFLIASYIGYKLFRVLYVFITKRVEKPDLSSDIAEHTRDMVAIDTQEAKDIAKIDEAAEKKKQGIDAGTPLPSEVFNETIRETKEIKEESKTTKS